MYITLTSYIKSLSTKLAKVIRRMPKGDGQHIKPELANTLLPADGEEISVTITSGGVATHETVSFKTPDVVTRTNIALADIGHVRIPPVGQCIYCGTTVGPLTKEHIIPFGLSGNAIVPAASCTRCARVTSQFELDVLRGPMRDVRVYRKLQSRSKHAGAKRRYSLKIERNGCIENIELPLEEFPILLHFITFAPPRVLASTVGTGIDMAGIATVGFGPDPKSVGKRLGAKKLYQDLSLYHPIPFARMIGKIGYAWAVAQGAIDVSNNRPEIVASILGELDEIGQWVGTKPPPFEKYPDGTLHRMQLTKDSATGSVVIEVQLFADSAAPTYIVVIR